jgi:hypothetical protein
MLRMAYFTTLAVQHPAAELLAERLSRLVQGRSTVLLRLWTVRKPWSRPSSSPAHYHEFRGERKRYRSSPAGALTMRDRNALRALGTVLPMRQIMEPLAAGGGL